MISISLLTFLTPALPREHNQLSARLAASNRIETIYNVIVMPECRYSNGIWYCATRTDNPKYKVECPKFSNLSCYYPSKEE
jgi:hypothetical protein